MKRLTRAAICISQATKSSSNSKHGRVRRTSRYVGDSEIGIDCKICGDGKNEDAEAVIRDQAAQSPISHDLGCHEDVHQQSLERGSHALVGTTRTVRPLFNEGISGDCAERK